MMADQANISHGITTGIFGALLIISFVAWYLVERTLSIHSIYSARREAFYWNVVLWTFELGTSTGDQMAEDGKLGYWRVLVLMLGILLADFIIYELFKRFLKPPQAWIEILTFWIAYILTRPLGASIGDLLTADRYPSYGDSTTCFDIDTSPDGVGCSDPDVFCITNCGKYEYCTNTDLTCPPGPNTCLDLQPTCYTPLACPDCWGLEGIMQTNIAFACAFIALVIILAVTRYD